MVKPALSVTVPVMVILDVVCEKRSVQTVVSTNIIRYRHRRVTLIDKQRFGYNKRDMAKVEKGIIHLSRIRKKQ
jgi:hypothetical protein